MKKAAVLFLAALILISTVAVYATGGSSSDPLISLRYLNNTYIPSVLTQAEQRISSKTQQIYDKVTSSQSAPQRTALLDQRYKRGDVLSLSTGSGVLLLAGSATVNFASGAVVDLTDGVTLASGGALKVRHRYLVAEQTTALVAVTSDTAVLSAEGNVSLSPSTEIDYNALAQALQSMGIFRGTDTGFGFGFDLEKVPTRIEGLIMFLRLMGEEDAALLHDGDTPFVDVPDWCKAYVSYAYEKGYTNGVGLDLNGRHCFGTTHIIGAGEYITFLLRALGYQDSGNNPDFTWDTAISKAATLEVLTSGEQRLLNSKTFLRAQLAYLSYFSLEATMKDGNGTLLDHLITTGALNSSTVNQIIELVQVSRAS